VKEGNLEEEKRRDGGEMGERRDTATKRRFPFLLNLETATSREIIPRYGVLYRSLGSYLCENVGACFRCQAYTAFNPPRNLGTEGDDETLASRQKGGYHYCDDRLQGNFRN